METTAHLRKLADEGDIDAWHPIGYGVSTVRDPATFSGALEGEVA